MSKTASILLLILGIFITGCASHPVVHPGQLRKNERVYGYALSAENIIPILWFRRGLDADTEIGYRVGLPISGSGVDLSRVLTRRENKWDVVNLAWSLIIIMILPTTVSKRKKDHQASLKRKRRKNLVVYHGMEDVLWLFLME